MHIIDLRVNHLESPLSFALRKPSLSWAAEDAEGKRQNAARVTIAGDADFQQILFDSGILTEISSLGYEPDFEPEPRRRYFWKVGVWSDREEYAEGQSWFETGKIEEEWSGQWIRPSFESRIQPRIAKSFEIKEGLVSARLYATCLGVFEWEINGVRAGDEYLAPFYQDYNNWLQVMTYDITDLLKTGMNRAEVLLGNGWYKGRFGFIEKMECLYGKELALLCEIRLTYADEEETVIGSDTSWMCRTSAILESSIYDGEIFDARLLDFEETSGHPEMTELSGSEASGIFTESTESSELKTGFKSSGNSEKYRVESGPAVLLENLPKARVMDRLSPPVRGREHIRPVELIHTPAGETVLDFGQNMVGIVAFTCREPAGAKVYLQFGELLQEDNFYRDNLRSAKAEYTYFSDGKERMVYPHFTFYGFRYVKVEGISDVRPEDFVGIVIHSDIPQIGSIHTSNEKVNRLFLNALWGQKGNFLDVPTDCPQRDERMGWTGDAQVFCGTASYNMYTPAFYDKYLYDMALEQKTMNGSVPHVVPDILDQIMRVIHKPEGSHGACAWSDAATVIPWTQYEFFGDRQMLDRQYDNMKMWTDYIYSVDEEKCGGIRLWKHGFHFGDWLALDNPDKTSNFGGTDNFYVASAYYYWSANLTARAAKALGKAEDEVRYSRLAEEIKDAFRKEYFDEDGNIREKTQTAIILALHLGLAPEGKEEKLKAELKEKLEANSRHLDTGFVGTPLICRVLSESGLNEYAYTLLLNEDYPSWLYEVNMGATTIWERWNSVLPDGKISDTGMNSMNHYAYGSIVEWMYRNMCGLNPDSSRPGFKRALIHPWPDKRMEKAAAVYHSASGTYEVSWAWEEDGLRLHLTIPFDAEAEFTAPEGMYVTKINETEQAASENRLLLEAGTYEMWLREM